CRHRGYRVVEADAKECKVLRCRYHTWTYDLAGNLRRAPGTEDEPNFIRDELGLRRVAVDTWAQAVFVNPNPNAPPLREAFTRLDDWTDSFDFDPDPASYTLHREVVSDIEANWKLWWDNGTECYHCPSIHGSSFNSVYNTVGEDHRFETDRNMLSATFVTKRRETGELSSGKYRSIHLMPGFQAVQQSDFMLLSKMTPTSPSSCRFTVHYLAEVGADPARVDQWIDIWHATYLEDAEAISIQQQNMNIPDAPPFRYVSEREGPSIHVLRQYWETCKEMLVDDADRCN
ncbi:MAG: SRPBCC family protein, partial [Pseudomonadota bacterium]